MKSSFLHGDLKEQVFVDQPSGYVKKGNEHKVYKLKKALYGLKQAPRSWYSHIESYFLKKGFHKCPYEHTLFTRFVIKIRLLLLAYTLMILFLLGVMLPCLTSSKSL